MLGVVLPLSPRPSPAGSGRDLVFLGAGDALGLLERKSVAEDTLCKVVREPTRGRAARVLAQVREE